MALCRDQPDAAVTLDALLEAGPQLWVSTIDRVQLVELHHPNGRLLLTTEGPRLVQVPGEARRLLGITKDVPHPVWWVESRAPGSDPEAEAVARRFTDALIAATGGVSWSSRGPGTPPPIVPPRRR